MLKKWTTLACMLVTTLTNACDTIKVMIKNNSDQTLLLQPNAEEKVLVKPHQEQQQPVLLVSYKEKFCSVVEISLDNGVSVFRYVIKPKQSQLTVDVTNEGKLEVKGCTGPLKY